MYIEGFEQWYKVNKNLTSPFGELNKATSEVFKRIAEQNLEIVNENYSRWTEQLKRLSSLRKPEDLLSFQRECLTENISAGIDNTRKIMHMSMENMEELTKLYSSAATKVTEKAEDKAQKYAEKAEKETR